MGLPIYDWQRQPMNSMKCCWNCQRVQIEVSYKMITHILFSQMDTTICFHFPIPQIVLCREIMPIYWVKAKEKRENAPHIVTAMNRNTLTAMRCMLTQRIWRTKNRKTAKPSQFPMMNTLTFYRKKAKKVWCSHLWFPNRRLRYSLRSFSITGTILLAILLP